LFLFAYLAPTRTSSFVDDSHYTNKQYNKQCKSILRAHDDNRPKSKKRVKFADERITVTKAGKMIKEDTFTDISMGKKSEMYRD
jgi:hypothetical protein